MRCVLLLMHPQQPKAFLASSRQSEIWPTPCLMLCTSNAAFQPADSFLSAWFWFKSSFCLSFKAFKKSGMGARYKASLDPAPLLQGKATEGARQKAWACPVAAIRARCVKLARPAKFSDSAPVRSPSYGMRKFAIFRKLSWTCASARKTPAWSASFLFLPKALWAGSHAQALFKSPTQRFGCGSSASPNKTMLICEFRAWCGSLLTGNRFSSFTSRQSAPTLKIEQVLWKALRDETPHARNLRLPWRSQDRILSRSTHEEWSIDPSIPWAKTATQKKTRKPHSREITNETSRNNTIQGKNAQQNLPFIEPKLTDTQTNPRKTSSNSKTIRSKNSTEISHF